MDTAKNESSNAGGFSNTVESTINPAGVMENILDSGKDSTDDKEAEEHDSDKKSSSDESNQERDCG